MREIKFRAWDKITRKWIFEGLTINQIASLSYYEFENKDVEFMQFTGLKDKNGKEIYEGYIINVNGENICITFEDGCFGVYGKDNSCALFELDEFNIIGNIYENPELLTK
jgi:uncharacterized phage protein (TIGR01671 family)